MSTAFLYVKLLLMR